MMIPVSHFPAPMTAGVFDDSAIYIMIMAALFHTWWTPLSCRTGSTMRGS